jgi:glycosyltransferase involved in cell wall biosynthesis
MRQVPDPADGALMPAVSIILPTFNRVGFLRQAVESAFNQTYADWEMVIADDGSAQETKAYLRSIADARVRTIWLQHCGNPSRVRNAAIATARGRYLAFLDSDDVWAPSKLQKQIDAMRDQTECRWSYTACDRIDENGDPFESGRLRPPVPRGGWIFEPLLRLEIAIAMPSVVADRALVAEVGGFDEEQRFGEFHDLCLRLALKSEAAALREPLCSIRAHQEHYSANRIAAHASWMRLYEKVEGFTQDRGVRACCARMRMETSLQLASLQHAGGDYRAALGTLGGELTRSWRYPKWWVGALKGLAKPAVPGVLIAALRRRRG